jgi:RHS repeat-associated protein
MTDSTGAVVWSADYKPFGEATITVSTITNNLRFPGQYYDAETGLYYNYMRDYNPSIGRYPQADPIGLKGGINLYAYVADDPVNWFDPDGQARTRSYSYINRPCQAEDWQWANQQCGSKGAKECGVVYRVGPATMVTKVNVWYKCNDDPDPKQCSPKKGPSPAWLTLLIMILTTPIWAIP